MGFLIPPSGFNPLWFGILFIVNMQMAYLTSPFGFVLFYMKGVVPPHITMGDIYRSVWPFIGLQAVCLLIINFLSPSCAMASLCGGHVR